MYLTKPHKDPGSGLGTIINTLPTFLFLENFIRNTKLLKMQTLLAIF